MDGRAAGRAGGPGRAEPAVLAAHAVSKSFGSVQALHTVDLDVRPGRVHALVGENGAGKSTLARILAGIERQDSGVVTVRGTDLGRTDRRRVKALGVGLVPQQLSLVGRMDLVDNFLLGTPGIRADRSAARELLARTAGEAEIAVDLDRPAERMGLGQRQLGEIVLALAEGATVLLLDEPTASLGPLDVGSLFRRIRHLCASGTAVLLITHRVDEVQRVADDVTVLSRGHRVHTGPTAALDGDEIARLMVGELPAPTVRPSPESARPNRLEIESLSAVADAGSDLQLVDLVVDGGEIVGVAGVAGSGQQALAETIVGIRPAASGTVRVDGTVVTGDPSRALACGVAWIPEDRPDGLVAAMSVGANATLLGASTVAGAFARRARTAIASAAAELCRRFDVRPPDPAAPAGTLSGGNQQKLLVGRELAAHPAGRASVVVAHGPTQGLDLRAAQAVRRHLVQAAADGAAVLLLSTDLDELLELTDRVVVLVGGRLVDEMPTAQADTGRIGRAMAGLAGAGPAAPGTGTDLR